MSYRIGFVGGDEVATQGRIFQNDGHIFLCAAGLLVKVPSKAYHEKMHQ